MTKTKQMPMKAHTNPHLIVAAPPVSTLIAYSLND